jgi:hypothetical protein
MTARLRLRRWTLWIALLAGAVSALLALSGGFEVGWLGLNAHDPLRPLLLASLALTTYLLSE